MYTSILTFTLCVVSMCCVDQMDRYRYFIFNQRSVVVLGILQVACGALCIVCGVMDAVFRKDTPLSTTRAPVWAGLVCKTLDNWITLLYETCPNVCLYVL